MRHRKGYITRQAKRLTDGEINRRRFVMSALSAGVTMPTALSLASKAEASVPKPGGRLRIAVAEGTASSGSYSATDPFGRLLAFTRGNALTEILPDGRLVGELAETFETPDAGQTWVFDLRRDVMFHDGRPLTAVDVVATLNGQRPHLPADTGIKADGAHRVLVSLAAPDRAFAQRLAQPQTVILPAEGPSRNGTGPYRLDRVTEDGGALFTRNAHYWKPGRAHVEQVELIPLPDLSARQTAILAGDVDYADGIDPRALAFLQRAPNVTLLELATGRHIALSPEPSSEAEAHDLLETVRPRLPYRTLVEQILLGHGTAGGVTEASDLVLAAGAALSLRLAVHDEGVPRVREAAQLIADHLSRQGMDVELVCPSRCAADGRAHVHIGWRRSDLGPCGDAVVALWANDISAHSDRLTHEPAVATNLENDGARLAERWWFA